MNQSGYATAHIPQLSTFTATSLVAFDKFEISNFEQDIYVG